MASSSGAALAAAPGGAAYVPVPRHLTTRLLYPNPCCALVTANDEATLGGHNVMTITWLTPVDNLGLVFLSLNASRHSAGNVLRERGFSLSVLTEAQRSVALACGSVHGTAMQGGKLAALQLSTHVPEGGGLPVLADSPAHLWCSVVSVLAPSEQGAPAAGAPLPPTIKGHLALLCLIDRARVRQEYWATGKLLTPAAPGLPRLLCFLGSGVFAAMEEVREEGEGQGVRGGAQTKQIE
jgi:flavin reductase (DIM6/NTAB) family NADH-FMN oxidoreductase RutF